MKYQQRIYCTNLNEKNTKLIFEQFCDIIKNYTVLKNDDENS